MILNFVFTPNYLKTKNNAELESNSVFKNFMISEWLECTVCVYEGRSVKDVKVWFTMFAFARRTIPKVRVTKITFCSEEIM
jgi:hypothetical protein